MAFNGPLHAYWNGDVERINRDPYPFLTVRSPRAGIIDSGDVLAFGEVGDNDKSIYQAPAVAAHFTATLARRPKEFGTTLSQCDAALAAWAARAAAEKSGLRLTVVTSRMITQMVMDNVKTTRTVVVMVTLGVLLLGVLAVAASSALLATAAVLTSLCGAAMAMAAHAAANDNMLSVIVVIIVPSLLLDLGVDDFFHTVHAMREGRRTIKATQAQHIKWYDDDERFWFAVGYEAGAPALLKTLNVALFATVAALSFHSGPPLLRRVLFTVAIGAPVCFACELLIFLPLAGIIERRRDLLSRHLRDLAHRDARQGVSLNPCTFLEAVPVHAVMRRVGLFIVDARGNLFMLVRVALDRCVEAATTVPMRRVTAIAILACCIMLLVAGVRYATFDFVITDCFPDELAAKFEHISSLFEMGLPVDIVMGADGETDFQSPAARAAMSEVVSRLRELRVLPRRILNLFILDNLLSWVTFMAPKSTRDVFVRDEELISASSFYPILGEFLSNTGQKHKLNVVVSARESEEMAFGSFPEVAALRIVSTIRRRPGSSARALSSAEMGKGIDEVETVLQAAREELAVDVQLRGKYVGLARSATALKASIPNTIVLVLAASFVSPLALLLSPQVALAALGSGCFTMAWLIAGVVVAGVTVSPFVIASCVLSAGGTCAYTAHAGAMWLRRARAINRGVTPGEQTVLAAMRDAALPIAGSALSTVLTLSCMVALAPLKVVRIDICVVQAVGVCISAAAVLFVFPLLLVALTPATGR